MSSKCLPCRSAVTSNTTTKCDSFEVCVGNYVLVSDGTCVSLLERAYQIPDGTYNTITFENGCIVNVANADLEVYTPQACCGDTEVPSTSGQVIEVSKATGNLLQITNGVASVTPAYDPTKSIKVSGDGTATRPYKVEVKVSSETNNRLTVKDDGLYVGVYFETNDNVKLEGDGTKDKPYKFTITAADAKLPEVNKEEVEGNGYTIDKQGRVTNIDDGTTFLTNLAFSSPAFTVINSGVKTLVDIDETLFKTGVSLVTAKGVKGKGTNAEPLELDLTEDVVSSMLDVISASDTLKTKLKQILGV